jgi:Transposase DDE domain
MLRLVRRGTNRGKLTSARFLLRLLGRRLGRVRVLLDAWFMRARLIEAAVAGGHTVIGRARRDLALYAVPRPPRRRRPGRPRKYGPRMTPERVEALPVHRSARILYGRFEVVRYRSCRVAARFLKGRVVRAVWVRLERPDRPGEERLLLCTDPALPATEVITSYAKRWSVEPLFAAMKHGWGLKEAWQQSRQVLMRWVTILAAGYALNQMLAYADPARTPGLASPAPWRPPGTRTAGLIRAGLARLLREVGPPALVSATSRKSNRQTGRHAGRWPPARAEAA